VPRFVSLLNARRLLRDVEPERQRVALSDLIRLADITRHGVEVGRPDWRASSHSIASTAQIMKDRVLSRAHQRVLGSARIRTATDLREWTTSVARWIDTFLDSPHDIHDIIDWKDAPAVPGQTYRAEPRSVVVLFAGLEADGGR
jgi:isoamylase